MARPVKRGLRLPRRDPAEVMGHACTDYTWREAREKSEYEYLPEFLEC